jgi:hypothetical protein
MISDGDSDEQDGKISFHEFKAIVSKGAALPTAELWKQVRQERRLDKGAKVAMRKLEDIKKKKDDKLEAAATTTTVSSIPPDIVAAAAMEAAEFFEVNEDTESAAKSAVVGVSMLVIAATIRKMIFRI